MGIGDRKIMRKILLMLVSAAFIFGCAESQYQKPEEPNIVWPLPPDKPRIKYIKSYNNTFDVEPPPGMLDKIAGVKYYSLQAPQGVVADREGNIYVADSTQHVIVVFKLEKKKLDLLGVMEPERAIMPIGLAIANDSKMLYAACAGSRKILAYDLNSGKVKFTIEGFSRPVGVAVDEKRGRIYVTDAKDSELKAFSINGAYISTIAKKGSEDKALSTPNQVALDKHGNIYVADIFNFKIKVFSPEGKFLKAIGQGPCTGLGCFSKINGVAIDSDDNIYALDLDFGNVQIFNQAGNLLLTFAGIGSALGRLYLPMQLYIDEKDRIYVADTFNFRVSVFQYLKEEK